MALIYPQNGDLTKLLKSARKKVPQSARLSAGGGVQKLKGQCPNAPSMNLRGASLMAPSRGGLSGPSLLACKRAVDRPGLLGGGFAAAVVVLVAGLLTTDPLFSVRPQLLLLLSNCVLTRAPTLQDPSSSLRTATLHLLCLHPPLNHK